MTKAEDIEMKKRILGYRKLNKARYYMVTFDLNGAKGREATYNKFAKHIKKLLGDDNAIRIIKQCYFVKSKYLARDVRCEMQTILLARDSILVARLQPGKSYSLKKPGAGRIAKDYFNSLMEDEAGK